MKKAFSLMLAMVISLTPMQCMAYQSPGISISVVSQKIGEAGEVSSEASIVDGIRYGYEKTTDGIITTAEYPDGKMEINKKYFDEPGKIYQYIISDVEALQYNDGDIPEKATANIILDNDFSEQGDIATYGQVEQTLTEKLQAKVGKPCAAKFIMSKSQSTVTATLREYMETSIENNNFIKITSAISVASLAASLLIPQAKLAQILGSGLVSLGIVVIGATINYKNCLAKYTKMVWINGGVWMQEFKIVTYKGIDSDGGADLTDAAPATSYYSTAQKYNDNNGMVNDSLNAYFA